MKKAFLLFSGIALFSCVHAQTGSDVQLLTDNFHANDRPQVPDPSQISYVTPPELLKSTSAPVVPDASQINYTTPPELQKTTAAPSIPDPSEINYTTPPELRKKTAQAQPAGSAPKK